MYANAKDIPSCKVEGAGVGDEVAILEALLGEPEMKNPLDGTGKSFEKAWSWDVDGESCSAHVIEFDSLIYSLETRIPTK